MKLLVTGAPGTGKTVLVEHARSQGYENFFDTDAVQGLCEWREYATGKVLGDVEVITPVGGESWYAANGWYWKPAKIGELLLGAGDVVVCGSADNVMEFYNQFDAIALLYKSREDIARNLLSPGREQPNGKDPAHHDRILRWQAKLYDSLQDYNPILIGDNTVEAMFDQVLQILNESPAGPSARRV